MNELEDIVSQQENALAAVNNNLSAAQRDNQQLKFQLDDAVRRAADEREWSAVQHSLALYIRHCL